MSATLTTSTLRYYNAITPNDGADVTLTLPDGTTPAQEAIGLCIGTAGTVRLTRFDGVVVNLTLPVGWHPIRYKRVHATGTTATGLTAGFRSY